MRTRISVVLLVLLSISLIPMNTFAAPPYKLWNAEFALEILGTLAEGEHTLRFVWEWTNPDPGSTEQVQSLIISSDAPLYRGQVLINLFWVFADVNTGGKPDCDYIARQTPGEWVTPTLHPDQSFSYFVRLAAGGDRKSFNETLDGTTFTIYIDGISYGTMNLLRTFPALNNPNPRIMNRMCSLTKPQ